MEKMNVLIFPAGSEIAFEINNALKFAKDVRVIGATSVIDHSEMVYGTLIEGMPFISDEGFVGRMNEIISEYSIDFIYPALDAAQLFLTEHAARINAPIVSSPYETVRICRSKKLTYEYLAGEAFLPAWFASPEDVRSFPVFMKPAVGEGSKGARLIHSRQELQNVENIEDMVLCEYLPGPEYTVDCFSDDGRLRYANMRVRARTRAGISVRSYRVKLTPQVEDMAHVLNEKFEFTGAWFFQVKEDVQGNYKLMEVSPRIPGTMAVSRVEGINFPLLTIYAMRGMELSLIDNDIEVLLDRAFINRFKLGIEFDTVYVDFDDTIIIDGKVCTMLMMLLYQFVNEGKKIVLVTRHAKDIYDSLRKYRIDSGLFDEIVHIGKDDEKCRHIAHERAIFIDDSFSERRRVQDVCGIPVFDVDAAEALLSSAVLPQRRNC